MKTILLVDDCLITHKQVDKVLSSEYDLFKATTIKEAEKILNLEIDISVVVIDRVLPDGDGLELCKRIRENPKRQDVQIVFISSSHSENDIVIGFYTGADDYIAKPFSPLEFKARIGARVRKLNRSLIVGDLFLDIDKQRAYSHIEGIKSEIALTRIEFKIISLFAQNVGIVFNREALLQKIWGDNCYVSDRVVDTHISHLRKKIIGCGLRLTSRRSEGYSLSLVNYCDVPNKAAA